MTLDANRPVGWVRPRNVLVLRWSAAVNAEAVRHARDEAFASGRAHPGGIGLLNLLQGGSVSMTDDTRNEATAMMKLPEVRASACVFLGEGFHAAILRSVVSGLALVAGGKSPIRVFSQVPEAET